MKRIAQPDLFVIRLATIGARNLANTSVRRYSFFDGLIRMETTLEINEPKAARLREKAIAYIELTKPRIAFMLVLTSAAGYYLGTRGTFDLALFAHSLIAITLLAFGVATLNQYWESETDKLMDRTANRPVPTGKVGGTEALVFGSLQCL